MYRRLGLLLIAACLIVFVPSASAKITVLNNDGNKVDTFKQGKCRVTGKKGKQDFFATMRSEAGKFHLEVFIDEPVFGGFDEDYTLYYGGADPQVFLVRRSDEEEFSNFKIPGTPAGTVGGGGIRFGNGGRKMGVGLSPASNKSFTEGYSFAGVVPCKYPKRRKLA